MIYCLYRISDNGYVKTKLPNATKERCLENFLDVFGKNPITILPDRMIPEKRQWLENRLHGIEGINIHQVPSERGGSSAQSFRYAMEYAINNFPDDALVYLVEDDYLHLPYGPQAIEEGLKRADYVTLYDCIDKYVPASKGGNPLIDQTGSDETRVILTPTTHWRLTNSTTCTFAAQVKTLKRDFEIWKKHCFVTDDQKHPNDFPCFLELRENNRTLISPIPSLSTHAEPGWLAPRIDWMAI